ncbi:potassium-transporting ATPase subunit KdpC [Rhodobacter sp. CZR27]|uniref:potassium-transporting ATPase subunit KdpC n=1 Tax=Rhodobacter sp. CZR27 TaxID=2033869 RepID=UPI000BBF0505|nr:potassium-transporting ATPase subunit KdpC [Rhodobacter sp. CZR27]
MLSHIRPALVMLAAMTLVTGLAYPLAMTGLAAALAPDRAAGSLIRREGQVVGSALIGQAFAQGKYLHPRPSASGWNAAGSSASNLGPTSAALVTAVSERKAAFAAANGAPTPVDAVTTSASGLDPHVSPETALAQATRIATSRGVDPVAVRRLIEARIEPPLLGLWGLPRVNVLAVNLALDAELPALSLAGNPE